MFSRIRSQFGTAGLVVAIVALIAALAGGAWAAVGLNGKQKKEVTKIAKKYAGKDGATGATGATGPAGATGAQGAKGDQGLQGEQGPEGPAGADGKSVVLTTEAKGVNCTEGGTKVEVEGNTASKKYVCNGEEGSPWTAGGVLPSSETETGTWAGLFEGTGIVPISFNIPLSAGTTNVVKLAEGGSDPNCDDGSGEAGSVANPEAGPGYLCVFTGEFESGEGEVNEVLNPATGAGGAGKTGGVLLLLSTATGVDFGRGTWAVTAP